MTIRFFFHCYPLVIYGTIKHIFALYIQQAQDNIIAVNIFLPHYIFKMNFRHSVNQLYLVKRVF